MAFVGHPAAIIWQYERLPGSIGLRLHGLCKVDARFAKKVVAITDHYVPYPANPISIPPYGGGLRGAGGADRRSPAHQSGGHPKDQKPVELAIADYASPGDHRHRLW